MAKKTAETHRWHIEHIRQGLREADAGRFAPAATVRKVMTRLRRKRQFAGLPPV